MTTPKEPTPEHERLLSFVGTWNVDCTFFLPPPQEPLRTQAIERVEALGPYFTVSLFEADLFGTPFRGRATMGYDPLRGMFVSTWIDTMQPHLFHFTGTFDPTGKVLLMQGEGPSPSTGELCAYSTREEHHDDGSRTLDMFVEGKDAQRHQIFSYHLTRAEEGA